MLSAKVKSMLHSVKVALPALQEAGSGSLVLSESTSVYCPGPGGVLCVWSKFTVPGW